MIFCKNWLRFLFRLTALNHFLRREMRHLAESFLLLLLNSLVNFRFHLEQAICISTIFCMRFVALIALVLERET